MAATEQEKEELLYSDKKIETNISKCPNCGGNATFSAKLQKMKCGYCGSVFDIVNEEKVTEKDITDLINNGKAWTNTEVYQCQTCGAKTIISKTEVAHTCSFCGTTNVVKTKELSGIKPQGVIPFKLDKDAASTVAKNWAKKKFFAPNDFKKSANAENIHGVYNPAFTFDSVTSSKYSGRLGKTETYTTTVNGKTVTHSTTKYFDISGSQDMEFNDLIIQASSTIPDGTLTKISPFPTQDAPAYKEEYLHGFSASTYSKSGEQCWKEGQTEMKKQIEAKILKKYDYDIKVSFNLSTNFAKNKYKFVLVPVYVGHFNYKAKLYNFFINGFSGKMTGKSPVSPIKVFFFILGILVIIAGIIWLSSILE